MSEQSSKEKTTFAGSCHCKNIRYEVSLALPTDSPPTAVRCNCTICLKSGYTGIELDPADFHLLSPSSRSDLSDYQFRVKTVHRYFCNKCGVQVFGEGKYEYEGKMTEFFTLNALTLDPHEGLDLREWKIEYWDGKNDNWHGGKKDAPWPGGCV